MSTPCESKYQHCQIDGCNKAIECYGHSDEPYCPEHYEEYEKFVQFMQRYEEEQGR